MGALYVCGFMPQSSGGLTPVLVPTSFVLETLVYELFHKIHFLQVDMGDGRD